ncbi:hypothetical protein ZWY2020_040249 [Hordeum vulgare]|nr:hypothetical protein ZWY2020_040249 [Hordeum vulgare]
MFNQTDSMFWTRRTKTIIKKTTKPPSKKKKKKKKSKGKAAAKESSVMGESRAVEEQSEDDDYDSEDEDVEPEEVVAGFPELKDDASQFTEEDYHYCVKDSRSAATQLAASLDLGKYQAAYDESNKKVTPPSYEVTSLTPRRRKNPFHFEVDPSAILSDEDEFVALTNCNWKLGDLQNKDDESLKQDDPEAA